MELDCGEYAFKGSTWLANITARWVITTVYGKGVSRQGYLDRGYLDRGTVRFRT